MRRARYPELVLLAVAVGSVSPVRAGQWQQSRHDASNSGAVRLEAPDSPLAHAWSFDGSGRVWGYQPGMTVWSSPALGVVDGRAVVAIGSYDHSLYLLDAATGDELWRWTTGDGVYATPTLWHDGADAWVFATSSDRLVYALDARGGHRRWVHEVAEFRPTLGGARLSSAVLGRVAGRPAVFFSYWLWDRSLRGNTQEAAVVALDARTGKRLWRQPLGDNALTSPVFAVTAAGGRLALGSHNGKTLMLDADSGAIVWQRTAVDAVLGTPALVETAAGPRVVTASKAGVVHALDANNGEPVWTYRTGDWITAAPAVATLHSREMVLVGSYDRWLYALDLPSGELVWRYPMRGGAYAGVAAIDAGTQSQVVVSSWDHFLHAAAARDGAPLWRVFTGRPLWDTVGLEHGNWAAPSAARINGQWMIYAASYDGTLYAWPLAQRMAAAGAGERSNIGFWVSFPLTLILVAALALVLTRRARRRQRRAAADG